MKERKRNQLRILLIDDDEEEYILTRELLADRSYSAGAAVGFSLDWVDDYDAALGAIKQGQHDAYLVDYRLGSRDGLQLIREAAAEGCSAPFILMTGHGSYSVDVEAMKVGATDYLVKGDLTPALLERAIRFAIERKRTEAMQRESEQRLRLALKAAQMGRWDLNLMDNTIFSYEDTEANLGLQIGAFPATYAAFLDLIHPEDRQAVHQAIQAAIEGHEGSDSYEVDFRLTWPGAFHKPDGPLRWLQGKGQVFRDSSGRAARLTSVISDITERKRAEDQVRKNVARAELLASLSQAYAESRLNFRDIISAITRRISESTGDICLLRLLSEDSSRLVVEAYHHPDESVRLVLEDYLVARRQHASEGLAWHVYRTGQPLLIPETRLLQEIPSILEAIREWEQVVPLHSVMVVPLRSEARLFGSISLLRIYSGAPYTPGDIHFYQDLADRAALALENARLYVLEARRASELDALQTATAALLNTIELEPLLSHILDVAQSAVPAAEKGMLYLLAPDTGQLQVRAVTGYHDPRIQKTVLAQARDYSIQALRDRTPVLISDTLDQASAVNGGSDRSVLAAPLVLGSETFGAISLTSSRPGAFTEGDLRLLVSFATTTTAAIQNAMLHSEVQKLAITDSLTNVYNRRGFFELGRREVERAHRFGRPLSAILVDIDNFKDVNDSYGHSVGDEALQLISERSHTSIREVDILGRYGGDEFILLLPETDLFTACAVAERIRLRISEPLVLTLPNSGGEVAQVTFTVTASFGVANLLAETPDLPALIERADHAAYLAKRAGRNRVEVA